MITPSDAIAVIRLAVWNLETNHTRISGEIKEAADRLERRIGELEEQNRVVISELDACYREAFGSRDKSLVRSVIDRVRECLQRLEAMDQREKEGG